MVTGTITESRHTPDRTTYISSSCDRPVPSIQPSVSFGPSGIPKTSSITRSPLAFHSEDGDFGLLDIFVDSKDFELHETVRSLRFTAAATSISNLFPPTPRSTITLPPSSISEFNQLECGSGVKVVEELDDHLGRNLKQAGKSTATPMEVQQASEEDAAPAADIAKPLSPEAIAKARCQLDAFMSEPVTPPSAEPRDISETESRRPFSFSPRSRKIFEKLSIRRERKLPSRQAEGDTLETDDDEAASSGPQPLSKMISGLERLFSRISSTSKPAEQNGHIPSAPKPSSASPAASNPTAQRRMKSMFAKWRGEVRKFLDRFVD